MASSTSGSRIAPNSWHRISDAKERTVYVVNAGSLQQFLQKFELIDA